MKILGYCLLCLFVARVQSKPQITKLIPVEGLTAYQKQLNNTTKYLDKFLEKLRTTYSFVFRPADNSSNIEKILTKNAADLQNLKLVWSDAMKAHNYTDLKYPNNSLLDQVKSLSTLINHESKENSSSLTRDSSSEVKTTIKANASSLSTKEKGSKTKILLTLPDDDWFNDVQPLGQLELQNEELDKKNEIEIVTPGKILPTSVGRYLIEWLGSLFGLTYGIYAKLSSTACGNEKATQ